VCRMCDDLCSCKITVAHVVKIVDFVSAEARVSSPDVALIDRWKRNGSRYRSSGVCGVGLVRASEDAGTAARRQYQSGERLLQPALPVI